MRNHLTTAMFSRVASCCFSLLIVLLLFFSSPVKGQFMRLEILVDELFSITGHTQMDFGVIPVNSGWVELLINDSGAGQISISAEENIEIKVIIEAPSELVLNDYNTIPFRLETAYLQDGSTNTPGAIPFEDNTASFRLSGSGLLVHQMDPRIHRLRTDIYFFGRVYAGNISPGIYSGTIGVRVEYN